MSDTDKRQIRQGFIARLWGFLTGPSSRFSIATLVIFGGIGGIVFWGGFNWAMEVANTEGFCISCHEMRDNPLQGTAEHHPLQESLRRPRHLPGLPRPASLHVEDEAQDRGVQRIAAQVPRHDRHAREIQAHRLELAKSVWKVMIATDSRECRNCHQEHSMDFSKRLQRRPPRP